MMILVLARSSHAGGGARWTETFARGMNARGHDCRVIFTRIGDRQTFFHKRLSDILVESLCYRYNDRNHIGDLATIIDTLKPDRIIVDNPERLVEASAYSAWLQSGVCKVVFLCHTHTMPAPYILTLGDLLWKVVCVSKASADLLAQLNPTVIRNAVAAPPSDGSDVRVMMGIPPGAFVVGYVGRHDSNKNTSIIYGAVHSSNWWCLMAGPGAEDPPDWFLGGAAEATVHPYEVENVGDWYRAMNVFVLPSKTEGFPLSPMEALLCGTRVAMTPTSDYPQVFGDAVAFFAYGDPNDLHRAITNAPPPDIGQAIIAQHLTVDRMLDQWEAALRA